MCVLFLVDKKDRYGYELREDVNKYIETTEGALYPVLRRLVKDEYCEAYTVNSSEGPTRKYYRITDAGEVYLKELLLEWDDFIFSIERLREENK